MIELDHSGNPLWNGDTFLGDIDDIDFDDLDDEESPCEYSDEYVED